jgi:hypothetical protein
MAHPSPWRWRKGPDGGQAVSGLTNAIRRFRGLSGTAAQAHHSAGEGDKGHDQLPMVLPKVIDDAVAAPRGPALIKVHAHIMYFVLPIPPEVDGLSVACRPSRLIA